jgi:hypothetical protein
MYSKNKILIFAKMSIKSTYKLQKINIQNTKKKRQLPRKEKASYFITLIRQKSGQQR